MNNGGITIKNALATVAKLNAQHLGARTIHLLENRVLNQVARKNRTAQSGKIHETNVNCVIVIMGKLFAQNDVRRNNAKMARFWAVVSAFLCYAT